MLACCVINIDVVHLVCIQYFYTFDNIVRTESQCFCFISAKTNSTSVCLLFGISNALNDKCFRQLFLASACPSHVNGQRVPISLLLLLFIICDNKNLMRFNICTFYIPKTEWIQHSIGFHFLFVLILMKPNYQFTIVQHPFTFHC